MLIAVLLWIQGLFFAPQVVLISFKSRHEPQKYSTDQRIQEIMATTARAGNGGDGAAYELAIGQGEYGIGVPRREMVTEHKNHLNTILQRLFRDIPPLEYKCGQSRHRQNPWQCTVHLDGVHIGTGWGISKQYASEGAAKSVADYLYRKYLAKCPQAFR